MCSRLAFASRYQSGSHAAKSHALRTYPTASAYALGPDSELLGKLGLAAVVLLRRRHFVDDANAQREQDGEPPGTYMVRAGRLPGSACLCCDPLAVSFRYVTLSSPLSFPSISPTSYALHTVLGVFYANVVVEGEEHIPKDGVPWYVQRFSSCQSARRRRPHLSAILPP